jgi:hypothetical protein
MGVNVLMNDSNASGAVGRRPWLLALLVGFVFVPIANAQNAVVNGEFAFSAQPPEWNYGPFFTLTWIDNDGSPQNGSLSLTSSGIAQTDTATQCVPLDGAFAGVSTFMMGARIKNIQFAASSVKFDFFASTTCTSSTGTNTPGAAAGGTNGFTEFATTGFARPGGTNSVLVTLSLHSTSSNPDNAGVARFDHVYIGANGGACTAETSPPVVTAPAAAKVTQSACE